MLKIENLNKKFKNFEIKDVSFELKKGYIMGFIGPNGSGKTTTIKLIMNLLKKDSGSIEVFGKDNIKFEREIKDRIGFVYDEGYFYEDLTIKQMKNIVAPFYTQWDEKLFKKYMKDFSLDETQKINKLSKGMKMKFALAIALSHNADLIIMDEPTSGLDPIFRREILDILYSIIQDENKSIFFSTHITTDLERIADYITFIDEGKIVFSKEKDLILESYAVVKGGNEDLTPELEKSLLGFRKTNVGFEALTDDKNMIRDLLGEDVLIEKPSLEDIMFYIARRQ
ncbi:ABC transporter ATP-binding protein [Tissierella creatinophila]|uniref:ABC transporter ATP-binding protein YtrB n=1 Tax=Tissierella creatinophila DSM 6911 TaxID=1123403 RepID=A0A1U7M4Q3_TISCR|nr:ABC transporter ATP-binding protein [Tissierella creatinophila]OLS02293.1 ABC transporter ATP-binding protein YtrB [Tissierella creatinophila DSM 6911]